ncbi:adenosylmethionine-8-amino-7-oxononanoate aminotransferase [Galdieria sulphuraria]|uniref:Adenosylmethionine-8-amino-7-oxononanoate aminotransferase n=1 Tax=Galdieria sulphuraria TaxID=130081 RepID=M2XX82_GALSU|nr:adenosylmethionine-8-amino-7-oxononanoate aminotransferase [Galdieria sulphuraria]EME28238.1 adenosylmethionine-8-amino-7-oxononanoate aminotransferase [Galdieria sulphuraria]|eukprot:XP_005704758.1 adenosylmethionine-8-amino-7-oxononanoate aminotransferase [Galdieria sulphuraria]
MDNVIMWLQIWGANTNVGKTVISTGIVSQLLKRVAHCLYLKPVQTGYPPDDDAAFVQRHCKQLWKDDDRGVDQRLSCKKLFVFEQPLSAEEAARRQGEQVSDQQVMQAIWKEWENRHESAIIIETAGGVLSPLPSGTSQADGYRSLRLPVVLIGDGALGGISTTMTCYESLLLRGYDVPIIATIDQGYPNWEAWKRTIHEKDTLIIPFPPLPPKDIPLFSDWYLKPQVQQAFQSIVEHGNTYFTKRSKKWEEMEQNAPKLFWWPFTQHGSTLHPVIVDSAFGDNYQVAQKKSKGTHSRPPFFVFKSNEDSSSWHLLDAFDGVASWWTQGVGHAHIQLNKSMMKAAGRYGHVIFPQVIHQPAYQLSKELIETVGYPWANRAYYSDDGSTAIEIAIKMALRLYSTRHGKSQQQQQLEVLSFFGSYHGDTLGAMDCCPKGDYNELQSPWFQPKGVFIEPPRIGMQNGRWILDILNGNNNWFPTDSIANQVHWDSWDEMADWQRVDSEIGNMYQQYINKVLDSSSTIATLIIEPLIQGAGGMRLIDPCFQRILIQEAKKRGIPVIFDEVFSGIWRLGVLSSTHLLGVYPDIAAYAKLLTGGLLPMAVTLTTEEVFDAFKVFLRNRANRLLIV